MPGPNYYQSGIQKYVFGWTAHSGTFQAPDTCTLDGVTMDDGDTEIYCEGAKSVTVVIDSTPAGNLGGGTIHMLAGTGLGGTFETETNGTYTSYTFVDTAIDAFAVTPTPFLKVRSDDDGGSNIAPEVTVLVEF